MSYIQEYTPPDFLSGQSPEQIFQEMLDLLPDDIDMSEGSNQYNLMFPTAYEKALLVQFILTPALKLILPQYCSGYDNQADYHAFNRGMSRKNALYAVGELEITANSGTVIPENSLFSTVSINNEPAVTFLTTEQVTFTENTTLTVPIKAVNGGLSGNVAANTIILKVSPISGITSVTNPKPTTGGLSEESTDDLIERMVEFDQTQGQSYIGNIADYKRWAESTDGIGHATVIPPEDDTGLIKIIVTNIEGNTASSKLKTAVYNKIMSPDNPIQRLAPINAQIEVLSPTTETLTISAQIQIDPTITTIDKVKSSFISLVQKYLSTATDTVVYNKIGSILFDMEGVIDYKSLLVNGGNVNIPVGTEKIYTITNESVTLTAY